MEPDLRGAPRRLTWTAAAVFLLVATTVGCTAVRFADLQSEFTTLYAQWQACQAQSGRDTAPDCAVASESAMYALARDADKAAGDADNRLTKIGLYRLAATAGWRSHTPQGWELAEVAASKGTALCKARKETEYDAPRDCLLLQAMPAMIVHARTYLVWKRTKAARMRNPAGETPPYRLGPAADRATFESFATGYWANVWLPLKARRDDAVKSPQVDKSVTDYFNRQREPVYCMLFALGEVASDIGATSIYQNLKSRRDSLTETEGVRSNCAEPPPP